MFFFNDTNQSIADDKNKKKKSIKISDTPILRSDTIMFYFKTINFFQTFSEAKDRYNVKINKKNFVSFYFRDRQFFEKNLKQFVFVNKEKFLQEIKISFHIAWKSVKNVTIYFLKYQENVITLMNHYDILRKTYKTIKNEMNDQADLSSINFENNETMINLRKQLIIHKNLLNKQTNMIKRHQKERAVINTREKKMIKKLFKLIRKLNARKKDHVESNVVDANVFTFLFFAFKNLDIDSVNLTFQNKLINTIFFVDEKKFFDAFVFSKIKLNEWDVFKYAFNVKFQSASMKFVIEKVRLRYALIKITKLINKVVAHRLHIHESQIYTRVNDLINDFNVIYNERNFYAKNYVKLTVDTFRQFQTKTLTNYINRFNIIVAHCNMIDENKKFWFNKQLNQRLYNRFVSFFEQRTLHDLINVMRDVDWKLSFNSFKDFNNRNITFTSKIN